MKLKKRSQVGQISDMDMRLLRVFKAVVDCGGMAAAELELNIGISTISRHVKDLEIRLGLALCRRGRGGFSLTQEGEQIYAQTLSLLAATDAFRTGVDEIHHLFQNENLDIHIGQRPVSLTVKYLQMQKYQLQVWDKHFEYRMYNWLLNWKEILEDRLWF